MLTRTYENVTRQRLACMREEARRRVAGFARDHGYVIELWSAPDKDEAVWRARLTSQRALIPTIEVALQVSRDRTNRLTVRAISMPPFIPSSMAIAAVDEVYRACLRK